MQRRRPNHLLERAEKSERNTRRLESNGSRGHILTGCAPKCNPVTPFTHPNEREHSTIAFPYLDLDAAENTSNVVYSRSGYGPCDLDELAAEMGQIICSSFRLKAGIAKIFDVIDKDGRSSVKLTDLGKQIIEENTRRAARVEAFMRVPPDATVYEKYKGQKMPPMKALEREMASLGVAAKQTNKARPAFERSARQIVF